jgi:sporulation protein YlmC with PRC-barrel domain
VADIDLVCDLLDKQVVDRNGRELGRVDSIILETRGAELPLVAAIEIGLVTIAQRLHPFLGRCARAIEMIARVEENRPVRVPYSKVIDIEPDVRLDLTSSELATLAFEQKARVYVAKIPGAS